MYFNSQLHMLQRGTCANSCLYILPQPTTTTVLLLLHCNISLASYAEHVFDSCRIKNSFIIFIEFNNWPIFSSKSHIYTLSRQSKNHLKSFVKYLNFLNCLTFSPNTGKPVRNMICTLNIRLSAFTRIPPSCSECMKSS